MARPKEFNKDQALEDAMMLFWSQGYVATSVQHLLDTMGISRSSMYAEFGNKRDLFVKVLNHFNKMAIEAIEVISKAGNPADAVRGFYETGFLQYPEKMVHQG